MIQWPSSQATHAVPLMNALTRPQATLERLMLQSRQKDGDLRVRTSSRRRRQGRVGEGVRPSTYGGARATITRDGRGDRRGRETEAAFGDEEATTPAATPVEELPAGARPSTRYCHPLHTQTRTTQFGEPYL